MNYPQNEVAAIKEIAESVSEGNPLTPEQYEVLAETSTAETVEIVGPQAAAMVEAAYDYHVVHVVLADQPDQEALSTPEYSATSQS